MSVANVKGHSPDQSHNVVKTVKGILQKILK